MKGAIDNPNQRSFLIPTEARETQVAMENSILSDARRSLKSKLRNRPKRGAVRRSYSLSTGKGSLKTLPQFGKHDTADGTAAFVENNGFVSNFASEPENRPPTD